MKKVSIVTLILAILLIVFLYSNSKTENSTEISNNQQIEISNHDTEYRANKDYIIIKKPVATATGDKIEIKEIFWYDCPRCYTLISYIPLIKQSFNEQTEFVKQPVIFGDAWELHAWFFYVLEFLGETQRLHEEVFHAIHRDNINLTSKDQFIDWLEMNGIDKAKIKEATKAYSVAININKAKKQGPEYQIRSIPVFVINGKYLIGLQTAGSYEEMVKIMQYLVAKELE